MLLSLNDSGLIHMVPSMVNEIYIIRFAVCAKYATDDDMSIAFRIIQEHSDAVLAEHRAQRASRQSASNDSLDLVIKPTNTDHDPIISEEKINGKPSADVSPISNVYPTTKVRVNLFERKFLIFNSSLIDLGKYNQHDYTTSSCHIRKTIYKSFKRKTNSTHVRSNGFRCKIVFSKTNNDTTLSSIIIGDAPWS